MRLISALLATGLVASAYAQSSPGFPIQVSSNLRVVYNESSVEVTPPGVLLPRAEVLTPPTAYLPSNASNTSHYVLFLMDIDVSRNGTKTTLLHWFQPNLVAQPSALLVDNTTTNASTAVGAAYIPPTPPGGSGPHRYTFLLFEQPPMWAVPAAFVAINPPAETTARVGFNITEFVAASGLGSPIAANYLRVLNGTVAETSSASTMTMAAPTSTGATSSGGSMTSAASASGSPGVASATSAMASATATGDAVLGRGSGKELMVGVGMAVIGAAAWML